ISWTGISKGNVPAAIKLTIIRLILGLILTLFYVKFLLGVTIPVELAAVFMQIFLFVVIPLIAGQLTRMALIKRHGLTTFQKEYGSTCPPFSSLGVLGVGCIAMGLQGLNLVQSPTFVLKLPLISDEHPSAP